MRHLPLLALLALPLPALAQTDEGSREDRGFLTGLLEDALSGTARTVTIEGFEGALSSRATIDALTIADREGVWLRAEDLALQWNRSGLLGGRIDIQELSAATIEVIRPPVADPSLPQPEATPFSLPELPVSVQIGTLQADRIVLDEPLLGERLVLSLGGQVDLAGGQGTATLTAEILEGSEGSLRFEGGYSNETRVLALDLDLQEAEGGLAARALDLPGLPSIALSVQGTAPIDDYQAELSLATAGEPRVTGTFALQTTDDDPGEGYVVERAFGVDLRGDVTPLVAPEAGEFLGEDVRLRAKGIRRSDGSLVLTSLGVGTRALELSGRAEITPEGWPARIDLEGSVGAEDGSPVRLPGVAGTTVGNVDLRLSYDRAQGEQWTGTFAIEDLARPGLSVAALTLQGGGEIRPASGDTPGRFTADLNYAARGLAFADASLGEALGADLTGEIDLVRGEEGGPLRIRQFTLSGPGLEAQAEGTVAGGADGLRADASILLQAADLGRFAELTGLDLGGAADLTLVGSVRPLDGIFDLILSGTTQDLALGVEALDPFLAGGGRVTVAATRDETGLTVDTLEVATDAVTATGEATVTSGASEARFDLAVSDLGLAFPDLPGAASIQGTFDRAADGSAVLDAAITLPGARIAVDATQAASTATPEGESVPGPFTFAAEAAVEELGRLQPLLSAVAPDLPLAPSGAATLRIEGTAATDLATFDVTVDATTRNLALGIAPLDAMLAGEGSLAGRIARTGPESFVAEDLRIATDLLSGTVTAGLEDGVGSADVDLALSDVAPVLGGLSGPGRVAGTARRGEDGATDLDLDLTLPTGTAQVEGALTLGAEGAFDGTVTAGFDDIAPLGALVGRDLGGAVDGTATGTARLDLSAFDLAVEAATEDLRVGIEPVDALLAGDGAFDGRVARTGPDSFIVEDLTLETDLLSGTVTAAIEDGVGSADLDLALADVAPVLGGLSGPGRVTGTARQAADGTTTLDLEATLPTGTAQVEGTISGGATAAFDGTVTADFADIAPLGTLVGRDLGGAVEGTATGTARLDLSAFDIAFEAQTQDLGVGQPLLDPLLAGPGTFSGQVARDAAGNLTLDIDADTPLLRTEAEGTFGNGAGSGRFDVAVAEVAGLVPGLSGPATAVGTASRAADGTVAVDAEATAPGARLDVDATVAPPAQGYEVTGTADVQVADLSLLAPFVGRPLSGGIDATVSGSLLPSLARYDLTVDGTATNLSLGDPTLARLLAGTGTVAARVIKPEGGALRIERLSADFANIAVDATGDAGGVSFDARLADLGLFVPDFPGPVSASGTASLGDGGAATVDAQVTGPGGISARVAGTVGGGTVDLRATGDAPLALANRFIDPRRIEGPASFDLRLAGASLEALSGTVRVEGARLSDPSLGEAVTGITGTAVIAGGQATLDLSGALALGGALRVAGPVGLSPPFEAALEVTGTDLVIRDPELYEAFGDARLAVTGPLAGGALISGVVELSRVEGRVPSTGVGALGELPEVFHIEPSIPVVQTLQRADLSPQGGSAGGDGSGAARAPYGLDILLRAPTQVFVRGRGLDAELGGELRLTGTTAQVIPIGQFSLLRGRLDLLGQRFDLTEGSATIQGSFDAFVRLVARTTARTGTEIAITLEGPLSSPEVSFESNPELPEDEVLAQLLFGVDIASVTPLQAIRLASAVAELAGGGTGLVDEIRGGAGLADFDLTTTESGNVALRLGQYISENVYTDVVVSPEETEATINLDLTPDLTVRAGVTTEGETTLGIFFERDY